MSISTTRSASSLRTRATIVAAARTLFPARGIGGTSLRDVSAAAGMSHPGLLKHFPTKGDLLRAMATDIDVAADRALTEDGRPGDGLADAAGLLSEVDGFDAMSVLLGVTGPGIEPAGALLVARRLQTVERFAPAESGEVERSVHDLAMWSGLQMVAQYLPELAPLAQFLREPKPGDVPAPRWVSGYDKLSSIPQVAGTDTEGYVKGRHMRQQILIDATEQFTRNGYHGVSVRDLAASVGVSASTLLHHFGSKERLLTAVLRRRDELLAGRGEEVQRGNAAGELAGLGSEARRDAREEPGLIELYAVLTSEAASPTHPAHPFLAERYRRTIAYFTSRLQEYLRASSAHESGQLWREAVRLVALWDGLQVRALRSGTLDEVGAHLDAHMGRLLSR
ncbi:hypothetical protein C5E10_13550 [Pseudoclavibacter sp. RFBG4]|uniref:TetR/AcrR family transcriptional regulator n=1 Tax=Pseudoclavibacter sp. RFBG4 TaxID=2080575 RepID=UPI000CE829AB|nr:TetR/AcrR family transcriptional regulator [Pseudoclavibacter sp. RFBG4]PPG28609.1 hypothetical protein C5E10_13550 [Pseudoclavibacter sp. RFBG4]